MEKIIENFEKALELIGGSANGGAFGFWIKNQENYFPNLRFVYKDGVSSGFVRNKWLIGLKIDGILIGSRLPEPAKNYNELLRYFRNYKSVLPVLPPQMICRGAKSNELEQLFQFRDEISLAFLLMGKPAISGKYWSNDFISKGGSLVKTFDFDRGTQCYNGVTRENSGNEILKALPVLEVKQIKI